jgi:hypothetical protein
MNWLRFLTAATSTRSHNQNKKPPHRSSVEVCSKDAEIDIERSRFAARTTVPLFLSPPKKRDFTLAIESRRHTDPATGTAIALYAVWKPEPAHATDIHDDELNEKYKAVTPERARSWWTQKYSSIPPIETLEMHIISGQASACGSA